MDSMNSQRSPSHIASSFPRWRYEVFISFRGEDTRKNFTDLLHAALKRRGIHVFKDDKELEKGKSISPVLSKAIEDSRISIIVFSENYASSSWCLDELVKILQCMKMKKQIVIPIFYEVDPSVVRKQTGKFQEAFAKHEEALKEDIERVQNWRTALKEAANLAGWDSKDRLLSEFIQDIIEDVAHRLSPTNYDKDLVGIDSRLEKLMRLLIGTGSEDVRMIGIYGMGGIGKTTIARVIYSQISHQFEARSFLADVRENLKKKGLTYLQKQLLSDILNERDINIRDIYEEIRSRMWYKKVLIVIDDVDEIEQLNELAGNHDWFGSDSRIIITTRYEHLLKTHGVDEVYMAEQLDENEALRLFSLKAFRNNQPSKDYVELSKCFLKYAAGLPLALKVLGSFLFGKTVGEWENALQRLGKEPEDKIFDCLKISFDGLQETEQKIFLDIACFFKGKSKDKVIRILDGCDFYPIIGIRVLQDKCLLTISKNNILWMHDLLQELGQQIVQRKSIEEPGERSRLWKKESIKEPGERSRLWKKGDIHHVLTENTGTKEVEGIILEEEVQLSGNAKVFAKMTNLRLLKIHSEQLSKGLEYLSNELRLLEWHGYALKSLPSSLKLDNMVELKMHYSCIEQLWKKIKPLNKLKVISLSHSKNLKKTPDFTEVPNLEELILEGCTRLHEIHPSLLAHKKLTVLNMKNCSSLTTLPSEIDMKSLKILVLSGCLNLKMFPEIVGRMGCLSELLLDRTSIENLPLSIQLLTGLVLLSLEDCKNLTSLPSNINELNSLRTLRLSGCPKLKTLPENLGHIESLEVLDIHGIPRMQQVQNSLYSHIFRWLSRSSGPMTLMLPPLSGLHSLKILNLGNCNLETIPNDIGGLVSLDWLDLSGNNFVSLPASMNCLSKLEVLNLVRCIRLQSLPDLPSKVNFIDLSGCASLETLSNAIKLPELTALYCQHCFKLLNDINSNVTYSMLQEMLDPESANSFQDSNMIFPGSEIPNWFIHRSEGSSIRIKSRRDLKLKGFIVCVVFFVRKTQPGLHKSRSFSLHCTLSKYGFWVYDHSGEGVPYHLWLKYIPLSWSNPQSWPIMRQLHISNDFEVKFESTGSPGLKIKRCGILPKYEDGTSSTIQWTNAVAPLFPGI